MSEDRFPNNGYTFRNIELGMQRDKMLSESGDIKRVIRKCQREYRRLSDRLSNCNVVRSLSSATACISSFALSSLMNSQNFLEANQDITSSPAKTILTVLTLGSFAVAGASNFIYNRTLSDIEENIENQQELEGDLQLNEDFLRINGNQMAINYVKGVIQRNKDYGQEDDLLEPEIDIIDIPLSHIEEVNSEQGFTSQSKIIDIDFTNPSAYFLNGKLNLPDDIEQ